MSIFKEQRKTLTKSNSGLAKEMLEYLEEVKEQEYEQHIGELTIVDEMSTEEESVLIDCPAVISNDEIEHQNISIITSQSKEVRIDFESPRHNLNTTASSHKAKIHTESETTDRLATLQDEIHPSESHYELSQQKQKRKSLSQKGPSRTERL